MVIQQNGLLMVALLCLLYDLQPADLESLAHQQPDVRHGSDRRHHVGGAG
ncbi:TPA: hypothetical protein MYP18_002324 [Citrobacter freundii]|nr:hypothetical protein [Citrobacter freundii]